VAGEPKRLNHPLISYLLGFILSVLALVVFVGVVHHLTISHHGPGLLRPLLEKHQEQKKSELLDEARRHEEFEKHRHFHLVVEDTPQLPESLRPVCFICHSDLPHRRNKRVRALMNLHTQFFVCETCHIREKPETTIVYQWYNPLDSNPPGPFYGTSYDPDSGSLSLGKDLISKIAPYFRSEKDGSVSSAIQVQDAPMARDFVKVRDQLSPEQREGIKNKFHENVKPKGHECNACHTENSILDFKQLGFVPHRIENLKKLIVVEMIQKYESWYLPELVIHGLR
jgi:DNA-directed RNA polymerase subunit M/transcription elongation factor TFIIS